MGGFIKKAGQNVKSLREDYLDMTQEAFAEVIDCSVVTISRIENGAPLSAKTAKKIADAFPAQCTFGWLMGESPYRTEAEWEQAVKAAIPEALKDWDETSAAEHFLTALGYWTEPTPEGMETIEELRELEDETGKRRKQSVIAGYVLSDDDQDAGWLMENGNRIARCSNNDWEDLQRELIEFARFKVHLLVEKRGVDIG